MPVYLARGGVAILQPLWERMLGRQAIFHRRHAAARFPREAAAHAVIGVHAFQHPAAAVEKQQQAAVRLFFGGIDAHTHLMPVPLDPAVPQLVQRRKRRSQPAQHALYLIGPAHVDIRGIAEGVQRRAHRLADRHSASPSRFS